MRIFYFLAVFLFLSSQVHSQEKSYISKNRVHFGYELSIGSFSNVDLRVNPNFTFYYDVTPKLMLGMRTGLTHLFDVNTYDEASDLEKRKIYFRHEGQLIATPAIRYYLLGKKFTPFVEGRVGIQTGLETENLNLTASGMIGMAIRFSYGGSINIGYQPEYVKYDAKTYNTDGTGLTVYRVINNSSVDKIVHNFTVNFLFK